MITNWLMFISGFLYVGGCVAFATKGQPKLAIIIGLYAIANFVFATM